jgi:hypothetical protein
MEALSNGIFVLVQVSHHICLADDLDNLILIVEQSNAVMHS